MMLSLAFFAVAVVNAARNNELDAFTSALDGLEHRIAHTGVLRVQRLPSMAASARFAETSVRISSAQSIANAPPPARTDNEWHAVAETALKHEKDTQTELMKTIKDLHTQLSQAQAHSLDLSSELVNKENQQQERFVEEVRKEERLRATQQQFMAKKLTEMSMRVKQEGDILRAEARANVTAAEHELALENQRLANATSLVDELQGWRKAAQRSFAVGQDKAETMEDLVKEKHVAWASARVAEQWRSASLKGLQSAIADGGVENASSAERLLQTAGESPEKYQEAMETVARDRARVQDRQKAQVAAEEKSKSALASNYPYASWELSDLGRGRSPGPALHTLPSDPLSFMHQPLPSTHVMDDLLDTHRNFRESTHKPANNPLGFLNTPLPSTGIMDRMMAGKKLHY